MHMLPVAAADSGIDAAAARFGLWASLNELLTTAASLLRVLLPLCKLEA